MHLVSLSQTHDAASVMDLSRSLEHEHEVRREVVLQVMRWFGEVDAANELWKMDVEKVVRQVGLGILRQHKARGAMRSQVLPPLDPKCFSAERPHIGGRLHGKVEHRRGRYLRLSHIPRITHRT